MKQICLYILFFFSLSLPSCIPDYCKGTPCSNGGVCVLGECSCLNGYEGANCNEVWNQRFLGIWHDEIERQPTPGIQVRNTAAKGKSGITEISLIPNGRPDQFLIEKLGGLDSVLCRRLSYTQFAVAEDQVIDSNITVLSGRGSIDSAGKIINSTINVQIHETTHTYNVAWSR